MSTEGAGSRAWARLGGAGWEAFWEEPAITSRDQASGQALVNSGPISGPLRCDTLSGEGGPAPAFPPAWDPSLHLQNQLRGYEVGGVLY